MSTATAPQADSALTQVGMDPALAEARQIQSNLALVKSVLAPDLNDQEMLLFAMVAQRSRLDPFAKQIYAIKRQGKLTFQTGIDGFRSSAEETGQYRGSDEADFGPIVDKPFPHPEWASVVIHRVFPDGHEVAQSSGRIYFDEFYPGDQQGFQWRKMPRVMLSKCAEAAAFRKAFPKRFADVYAPEEMAQADRADTARPVGPTARDRVAERRAAIEAATTSQPVDAQVQASDGSEATAPPSVAGASAGSEESTGLRSDPAGVEEGEFTESAPEGINAGELRAWLREHKVDFATAATVSRQNWGDQVSLDSITDEQRAELRDDLAKS